MKSRSPSPAREKSRHHYSPRRQSPYRRYHWISRGYRNTLIAVVLLYLLHSLAGLCQHLHNAHSRLLPTDFTSLLETNGPIWSPQHPVRTNNGTHIDERYVFMRQLGHGAEGDAAIYVDTSTNETVVVKTFRSQRGNQLPGELHNQFGAYTNQWRNEIEATILFGQWQDPEMRQYFVPVKDYFILRSGKRNWSWAMVTPFIEGGTLINLAKRTKLNAQTPAELDQMFRPVLHSLLEVLGSVHARGSCHDDIKLDNIFVDSSNATHWLLGDLGQVRHLAHPMHGSGGWKKRNQWSDCRMNDVRRLLKTYAAFLRKASVDEEAFDRALMDEREPWSTLYWEWMQDPRNAEATIALSTEVGFEFEEHGATTVVNGWGRSCLQRRIDQELTCTRLHTQWRDYWFMMRC